MAGSTDGHGMRVEYGRGAAEDGCFSSLVGLRQEPVSRSKSAIFFAAFRLKSGAEETDSGKLWGVGVSSEYKRTLLWLVKAPPNVLTSPLPLGLLQQGYVADATAPADEIPTLIGEVNSAIVLRSMADKDEESTGAREKSKSADFVVLGVRLKLRSASH